MKLKKQIHLCTCGAVALLLSTLDHHLATAFAQGSLTPPGVPAPTMKTLDQLEPRTPVDTAHTPGDSANLFLITQPGSYYLTANVMGVSGEAGIGIVTNNVSLDLNGFSLLGNASALDGIYIASNTTSISVRNGTISGWSNSSSNPDMGGIKCYGKNTIFEHLIVTGNSLGIYLFYPHNTGGAVDVLSAVVRDCVASSNAGYGILVQGAGCFILNNELVGNNTSQSQFDFGGGIAIWGNNNRIEGNHVAATGTTGYGIYLSTVANLTNNIVIRNSVEGYGSFNYSLGNNNIAGPLISTTASGTITNSNPWANFSF